METSVQAFPSGPGDPPIPPLLDVTILYEDFGTGLRAKRSLDLLPESLRANAKLSTKLWRTELLSDPFLCEQAAREAAAADVVILSMHGRSALPAEVQAWLRCWLRHKEERPYALGLLLDPTEVNEGRGNPVVDYMQQLAATARVDLFHGFAETPMTQLDPAMEQINRRAH
jgi:hypothetical protein